MNRASVFPLLCIVALALNHTKAPISLREFFIGTWDLYVSADDEPLLVQHKLDLNASALGGITGPSKVVTSDGFITVSSWELFLEDDGSTGTLSVTPLDSGSPEFVCPFDVHAIAPGISSSVKSGKSTTCFVHFRLENSTLPQLSLQLIDESSRTVFAATGSKRKSADDAPFYVKYGYYLSMAAIVVVQIGIRLYTQRCVMSLEWPTSAGSLFHLLILAQART